MPAVYLASYSHIDVAWRWPLQEGLQQSDATFRSVLRVLDASPELEFSETSASYYAWVRVTDPDTFARIARMVTQARWEPIGGWWTEADVNIVSGESLMRQAWFGQREFRDHLGYETHVAFLPDSFGSSANLPAILRAQGFHYYIMGRGTFADGTIPRGAFAWHSLGDSSIVTYNNPVSGGTSDPIKTVNDAARLGGGLLVWFGLGDHGGGPTLEAVAALTDYLKTPGAPKVTFSLMEPYLRAIPPPRTNRSGEIEGVFPGAYTNCYDMKRSMIDAERALIDCERFDVLAALCGADLAAPELDDLWQTLLLNQHHDTISATGLRTNVEAAIAQNRSVTVRASDTSRVYLESIVDRVPHAATDEAMLVVFNPLPHPVVTAIEYPLQVAPGHVPNIVDDRGAAVAAQIVGPDDPIFNDHNAPTCFVAELPAFGYAAYQVNGASLATPGNLETSPSHIEGTTLAVQLDARSGLPSALRDTSGAVALVRPRFTVFSDREDTWGSGGLSTYPEFGSFDLRSLRMIERGPVRTVVQGSYAFRNSSLVTRMELRNGERAVRFSIDADWNEPFMRLALAFEYPGEYAYYDIPFGVVERASAQAITPAISFVARPRKPNGTVGIVSCGSHGFWASPTTMGVTLARSTAYSFLDTVDYTVANLQDTGRRRLSVMVALCDDLSEMRRTADAFERPFPVLWNGVHDGSAPTRAGYVAVPDNATLASTRRVGGTIEARLHNLAQARIDASGHIGTSPFATKLDAYGIRTLQLRGERFDDVSPD
ncbi:MAG TPA: glycoside hydrolase family 38 C-terminal domain-containing protein [Verrucomicrobiae bacterium]|nr:glycoside hydrolase family 38 C-terminal domain-containing protein [Verrucomicrobiae bacterium]